MSIIRASAAKAGKATREPRVAMAEHSFAPIPLFFSHRCGARDHTRDACGYGALSDCAVPRQPEDWLKPGLQTRNLGCVENHTRDACGYGALNGCPAPRQSEDWLKPELQTRNLGCVENHTRDACGYAALNDCPEPRQSEDWLKPGLSMRCQAPHRGVRLWRYSCYT